MTEFSKLEIISKENAKLRQELQNCRDSLKLAQHRLIEAQEDLRKIKWMLVRLEESNGKNPR